MDIPSRVDVGDYIQITRIASHWHFLNSRDYIIEYPDGGSTVGYPVMSKENDQEMIIIRLDKPIDRGNNVKFRIQNIINTPYQSNEALIH